MRAISSNETILFQDEAVFTSKQVNPKVWFTPQTEPVVITKKKLSFKAIAVSAAIDSKGTVIAHRIVDGAIDIQQFLLFLDSVARVTRRRKVLMLVDNLNVHRANAVKDKARRLNIELFYNGIYSSTFNPIERLWAWAKLNFQRSCVKNAPYHLQHRMRGLVK